jgi:hypothetical protein
MESHLKAATVLTHVLDNQFAIAGMRLGLNSFLDLIPGLGDIVAALLSFYLVWIAIEMELPKFRIAQMLWNILVNFIIGLIPIIGDAVYIFRKANTKNLKILNQYAKKYEREGHVIQPRGYAQTR